MFIIQIIFNLKTSKIFHTSEFCKYVNISLPITVRSEKSNTQLR